MSAVRPVVLFGNGTFTRTLAFFLEHDSPYRVVAATVDRAHLGDGVLDLPLVAFEDVVELYPPHEHDFLVAIGYRQMNTARSERCERARAMGYRLVSNVSARASTWPDLVLGDNCLIMDRVTIHPDVRIGNDVIIWSGSHIGRGSAIGDDSFIASRATVGFDVTVGPRSFLGTNCTIGDGVTVAPASAIGAGAVITEDTAEQGVYAAAAARLLPGASDRLPHL